MKLSFLSKNRLLVTVKQSRFFFHSCFSMHIIPLLFALAFIVLADNRMSSSAAIPENNINVTGNKTDVSKTNYSKANFSEAAVSINPSTRESDSRCSAGDATAINTGIAAANPVSDPEVSFKQLSINYALASLSATNANHAIFLYKIGYLVSNIVR